MAGIVNMIINGAAQKVENPQNLTLLKYLREHLGLRGAKNGCSQGHCGTCIVIVDGKAKRACLVQMSKLAGSRIETIEYLSSNSCLHPLQEAFVREGAIQCGFCTPGMIMAAKALLDANPDPSDDEIKHSLRFNLCRCTGYAAILRAVKLAAQLRLQENKGLLNVEKRRSLVNAGIGFSPVKKDALTKVTGVPLYADDFKLEGMVYGKLLLSEHPYARILKINVKNALKQPDVITILTAQDIPGRNGFGLLNPHQPVLAHDFVRYMGDPVAVIFAESEEAAIAALTHVEVEYEPLQGVFSPEQGMREGAPVIHPCGNIMHHVSVCKGAADQAFAGVDVIIEGVYTTPMVEHAYLEPEAAVAKPEEDGSISIWTA
ncbi:MAG TPA: 2Fe-2S iron-sulfur cluster-binding protein, partial [Candidatus Limnocylindrales bacterium]|nr:2Fe-2S iron-sulfur cluster-binding protein [Candidatus Limnocylindrales bacterium]